MQETDTEVRQLLSRYVEIQRLMGDLETEKKQLREKLQMVFPEGSSYADSDLGKCKVTRRKVCEVEYDEALLRERLGDIQYRSILTVDWKRVRRNLDRLEPAMHPFMDLIGTPSADKVKLGIESGRLDRTLFVGAFVKTNKVHLAVSCKS